MVVNHQAAVAISLPSPTKERGGSGLVGIHNNRLGFQRLHGSIQHHGRDHYRLPMAWRADHGAGKGAHIMTGSGIKDTTLLRVHARLDAPTVPRSWLALHLKRRPPDSVEFHMRNTRKVETPRGRVELLLLIAANRDEIENADQLIAGLRQLIVDEECQPSAESARWSCGD